MEDNENIKINFNNFNILKRGVHSDYLVNKYDLYQYFTYKDNYPYKKDIKIIGTAYFENKLYINIEYYVNIDLRKISTIIIEDLDEIEIDNITISEYSEIYNTSQIFINLK